jgi:poly(3-hydroxybutyrate) depolymerase
MQLKINLLAGLCLVLSFTDWKQIQPSEQPQLKTISNGLMQYYVALPQNWSADKKWPIVVVCEAAEKEFKENMLRFMKARGNMPFIIIAPITVTNGNQGRRDPAVYPYTAKTWDQIETMSDCKFDIDGLIQAVNDVKKNYRGEDKVFITGFEAGTHLVWAMIFEHPELLRAAAPVAGNYIGRCVTNELFSSDLSRVNLPIIGLSGKLDKIWGVNGGNFYQWKNAKAAALAHGYKNITEEAVPVKGHEPLPNEVMSWFYSIYVK